jgi:hypothetical protein
LIILAVKLIVPAVLMPVFLYLSSIILSHDLANLLDDLAVSAVIVLAPCFLAILAARILAWVLPEIETINRLRFFTNKGFLIISIGKQQIAWLLEKYCAASPAM